MFSPPRRFLFEILELRQLLSAAFDVTKLTAMRAISDYSTIDGSGVGVAILDTGIYASNPDLSSNVVAFYNAVENSVPTTISSSSISSAFDKEGHGTHTAGTAASSNPAIGVAYAAKIVSIKVLADSGERQIAGDPLLRGLKFVENFADQFNIKVVNMSLGEGDQNGGLNLNSVPNADDISREIKTLESLGIAVVSSSGNSYANDPTLGASYPAVVSTFSVGNTWATNGSGHDFGYVSWGTSQDRYAAYEQSASVDQFSATSQRSSLANQVAAPGVDIYSTWNNSSSGASGSDLLHNTLSGTSMAAPFVTGMIALIQDAAKTYGGQYITSMSQLRQLIRDTADAFVDTTVSDNGRVPLNNGVPGSTQLNLPETGATFYRVNVLKAIQKVQETFTGSSSGTPTPGTETDNTIAKATAVPNLSGVRTFSASGNIGQDGTILISENDVDVYKLVLDSPGNLNIILGNSGGSTTFQPSLRLFSVGGIEIARSDISGNTFPSITTDVNNPLAIGTYYLGVSSLNNVNYNITDGSNATSGTTTGDYSLTISLNNPDPNGVAQGAVATDLTNADSILPGTSTTVASFFNGRLGSDPPPVGSTTRIAVPNGDVDMFKVIAPDTGVLTVNTDTTAYGSIAADTYIVLYNSSLNVIASNDDKVLGVNTDSLIRANVAIGETYYVAVTVYENRSFDPANPYNRVSNSTAVESYYDLYLSFNNNDTNGSAILARSTTVGATINDAIGTDSGIALLGANSGFKDIDFYRMGTTGSGLLDLTTSSSTSGFNQIMDLWQLSSDGTSISKVGTSTGTSTRLVYQVTSGQTYYVSVTGKGNQGFNWYTPASGAGGQTGSYSFASTLDSTLLLKTLSDNSIQNGTPGSIVEGTTVYGEIGIDDVLITGASDIDMYHLTPAHTGIYTIRTDTSGETSADTLLRVFDASGTQFAANDNASDTSTNSLIRVRLVAGQTYYIGVNGSSASAMNYDANTGANAADGSTGTYGLSAQFFGDAGLSIASGVSATEPAPGQTAGIDFTVSLDGAVSNVVTVDYSTADGSAIAGQDYIETRGTLTFQPGEVSQTIHVPILGDLVNESAKSFTVTLSNVAGSVGIVAGTGTGTVNNLQINSATLDKKHAVKYTDASDHKITWKLAGAGTGTVLFASGVSNPLQADFTGTTSKSILTILGSTSLPAMTFDSSLKTLSAVRTDLLGNLSINGTLGTLIARDDLGANISIAGGNTVFNLRHVSDASIVSTGDVRSIVVKDWLPGSDTVGDRFSATSLRLMKSIGDWDAVVNVAGDVRTILIGGNADNASWNIGGAVKSSFITGNLSGEIKVGSVVSFIANKTIDSFTLRSAGAIGLLVAGVLTNSSVFAGVNEAISDLPTTAGDFVADVAIKSVVIRGRKGVPVSFSNSRIAATQLGAISVNKVSLDNSGVPFGLAGTTLKSYKRIIDGKTHRWTSKQDPGLLADGGDFVVRFI